MGLQRAPLLADEALVGAAWCRAHADLVDGWLRLLFGQAADGASAGAALVAIGGYGRRELSPQSDIDVMLVRGKGQDVTGLADRVWYPIWDEGLHLGHSVSTVREALALADDDLDTATSLLSARCIAGDATLADELAEAARGQWQKRSKRWLTELSSRVVLRHEKAGEVAFTLEPDLKEGRGGMRDAHSLWWAAAADPAAAEAAALADPYAVLLGARVELQRHTGRPSNVLVLEDQDAVAKALGDADADALMARVAEAARTIAWTSDEAWRRIRMTRRGPLGRVGRRTRQLGPALRLVDGEVRVEDDAPIGDPTLLLAAAAAAATHAAVIDPASLQRMADAARPMPDPWPPGARDAFVALLQAGRDAVAVIEALDQYEMWTTIIPEWRPVRARPQRNPYHRYTVDRHLLEATANAARLADRVDRPDLLVIAALLHDIGKGRSGDHTEQGIVLARTIAERMAWPPEDVDTLCALVRHHLLLSEVATRRDLDDPGTISRVAALVGSGDRLVLLAALTEADSLATGSSAWGPWKAELVARLVERVLHVLEGGTLSQVVGSEFPTPELLDRLAGGGRHVEPDGTTLTVMTDDRPGLFSRIAGVLALHGLDVVAAAAYSNDGRALSRFAVADRFRSEIPWSRICVDLELALSGRLALNARLADRRRTYRSRTPSALRAAPTVHVDNAASADATVIDVYAPDGVGVLYRITRALAELDLDIRSAKVETQGDNVVDAFYVRGTDGAKVTDAALLGELERAITHMLSE